MISAIFSEKTVLVLVVLIGMAMCTAGIGQVAAHGDWLHPLAILAYLLGVLILGVAGAALFDFRLPLIDSTRAAIIAVILLAIIKMAITRLHFA